MEIVTLKSVPVVDVDYCTGCGACVEACGPQCLELVDNVAVLTQPDKCGSEEHCIEPCPEGCIRMEWVEMIRNERRGKWRIVKEQ
jgi:NAD-dependent dihydropyrimidine dehydrogenase PreA subunit